MLTVPGWSAVRIPTVKTYPFVHPGIDTRTESFGTGFCSWAETTPVVNKPVTKRVCAKKKTRYVVKKVHGKRKKAKKLVCVKWRVKR